jgi:hypothetical protein
VFKESLGHLAILLPSVDPPTLNSSHRSKQIRACVIKRVQRLSVVASTNSVEIPGVKKRLEPAEDPLVGALNKLLDVSGGNKTVVVHEGDNFSITRLQAKARPFTRSDPAIARSPFC